MAVSITARDLITRALLTLGVYGQGSTPGAADLQIGVQWLTELVDSWNIQALTVLTQRRTVYDLDAGRGGPDDPYTIGPGADFDTGTAARPPVIRNANLLLNTASDYPTEIPLAILTEDMYAANPIKSILNAQPSTLYYEPTVPWGSIQLWNVPNTDVNQLVLYTDLLTPQFADLSTLYVCPPGYLKAFRLCLAESLATPYGVPASKAQQVSIEASDALSMLKASNAPVADLSLDPAFTPNTHGTYVIQTDSGA